MRLPGRSRVKASPQQGQAAPAAPAGNDARGADEHDHAEQGAAEPDVLLVVLDESGVRLDDLGLAEAGTGVGHE